MDLYEKNGNILYILNILKKYTDEEHMLSASEMQRKIKEIYELTPSARLCDFNGYNNVLLLHKDLQIITKYKAPQWENALKNVKGIYAITDISNGKIYIGSAIGENGIWQRWCSYAKGLTGGNKDFINIVKEKGEDYIRNNFTYSILEIFDMKTKDDYIIRREHHWMKVFQTEKLQQN